MVHKSQNLKQNLINRALSGLSTKPLSYMVNRMVKTAQFSPQRGGVLESLYRNSDRLLKLQVIVRSKLPDYMAGQVYVAAFDSTGLVVVADNGSLASWLLLHRRQLIDQLSLHKPFKGLQSIKVKARPYQKAQSPPPREKPDPSSASSALLQQTSDAISDPDLKLALTRLRDTLESNSG